MTSSNASPTLVSRVSQRMKLPCRSKNQTISQPPGWSFESSMIPLLGPTDPFPPVDRALDEPNGLLAAGGGLGLSRLLSAYTRGIFPWFSEADPVLWWFPDPR